MLGKPGTESYSSYREMFAADVPIDSYRTALDSSSYKVMGIAARSVNQKFGLELFAQMQERLTKERSRIKVNI